MNKIKILGLMVMLLILVACGSGENEGVGAFAYQSDGLPDGPIVYIFNAHPLEMIGSTFADLFVGEMNVVELSHLLAEKLESHGISSLIEERCTNERLLANGWGFYRSYDATRYFLYDVKENHPSLQFFIDLHRDGIPHQYARADINGQPYAQVLFVVGTDNPAGYGASYEMARTLHNMMEERRPGISRGIWFSGGEGRNGVYNQDLSSAIQLIEMGTVETTVEEAMNTLIILAEVIAEFIQLSNL